MSNAKRLIDTEQNILSNNLLLDYLQLRSPKFPFGFYLASCDYDRHGFMSQQM